MFQRVFIPVAVVLTCLALAGCAPMTRETLLEITAKALPLTERAVSVTTDPEADETVQLTLAPASTAAALSAAEIFSKISPSVAFIETPIATGSGVLVEHGYILSNAHVVWPFQKVRVVFPDGSEYLDTPVQSWDLTADLALIGPLDVPQPPVALSDGGKLEIGSDVYLIGYPAEVDEFPQPSITNGILSRIRNWEPIDYTFFQVDATTVGGQSGGILVTHQGEVIGVSTFYYGGFGLAGSVADTLPRLNAMLGNPSDLAIDMRRIEGEKPRKILTDTLLHESDLRRYLLNEPIETEVALKLTGGAPIEIAVYTLAGGYIDSAEIGNGVGQATVSFVVEEEQPYLIELVPLRNRESGFILTSSHLLAQYTDPDDGTSLSLGTTQMGSVELIGDLDFYELALEKDDIIQITVDALEIDPYVSIDYASTLLEESVGDDDSGGGIFGANAQVTYRAPESGTYRVTVDTYDYDAVGSYFVTAEIVDEDAELTDNVVTTELMPSTYGPLAWYENEETRFAIWRPIGWEQIPSRDCAGGATLCYAGPTAVYVLAIESLSELPRNERDQAGYIALLEDVLGASAGLEIESIGETKTLQGLDATEIAFTSQFGRFTGKRLVYVDERQGMAFNLTLVAETDLYPEQVAMIDEFFASFRQWPRANRERDAVYQLDRGRRLLVTGEYDQALDSLNQSIDGDDTLVDAYTLRAWAHSQLGDLDAALADIEKSIDMEPDVADRLVTQALLLWQMGEYTQALAATDDAIAIEPEEAGVYNQRALIHVALGDFDAALDDIQEYRKLSGAPLPPGITDTRAFIYLMQGQYRTAKRYYEETYRNDFRSPYTLLGGGIAYAHLDELEMAEELIREGYAQLDELDRTSFDPQLAALLEMAGEVVPRE